MEERGPTRLGVLPASRAPSHWRARLRLPHNRTSRTHGRTTDGGQGQGGFLPLSFPHTTPRPPSLLTPLCCTVDQHRARPGPTRPVLSFGGTRFPGTDGDRGPPPCSRAHSMGTIRQATIEDASDGSYRFGPVLYVPGCSAGSQMDGCTSHVGF